jgi:hypothetical protein
LEIQRATFTPPEQSRIENDLHFSFFVGLNHGLGRPTN